MAGIGCLIVPAITVQDAAAWPLDMESIVRLNGYEEIKAMGKYQDWFNGADYHIGSEQKVEITQITQTESEGFKGTVPVLYANIPIKSMHRSTKNDD